MTFPYDDKPPNTTNDARPSKRTLWAVAGALILVLFGLLLIFPGRSMNDKSAENPPSPATQSQAQR
jgi:hypothetical protein